jgi:hypothetical protein
MKTIKNITTGTVKRVSDQEAKKLIKEMTYEYCPKHEWKKDRPKPKDKEKEQSTDKSKS